MGNNRTASDQLDKDRRKQLEKLELDWTKSPDKFGLLKLTLPDLRLLLEHFAPLQELLRQIAAPTQSTPPMAEAQSGATHQPAASQATEQLQAELQQAHGECSQLKSQCEAALHDLAECNAVVKKLLQEKEKLQQNNKTLKQDCKQLEKQWQQAQEQLGTSQAAQKPIPPELTLLRSDPDLAQRLDLPDLPSDDTQALIQTVAVLAQHENLERLWSALKDRCEADNRPASAPERALLETTLAWHNHNWRTRPYRLMEVTPSSAYHFENHLRSRQTPTGETVASLVLPGIADSSGKPLCKTLVSTR